MVSPLIVGIVSYLFAFVAFTVLTVLLAFSWKEKILAKLGIVASAATAIWAGLSAFTLYFSAPMALYLTAAELIRNALWCFFLFHAIGSAGQKTLFNIRHLTVFSLFWAFFICSLLFMFFGPAIATESTHSYIRDVTLIVWVTYAITGLLLVEHLFKYSDASQRWALKFLCLGIGSMFAYDFFMFSDALLFKRPNPDLWQARGFVNALAAPFIAISIARNRSWSIKIHVSRQVIFHSATLLTAGSYLLVMATVGYYIKYWGGTWGSTLQIAFLTASGAILLILLFSGSIRAKIRVLLSKHFFTYKYDYREEWRKFTDTLSEGDAEIPERCIKAISTMVDSNGGNLWIKGDTGSYTLISQWNMPTPIVNQLPDSCSLIQFLEKQQWLIDLDELDESPDLYDGLQLPDWLSSSTHTWLIVPLVFRSKLFGLLILRQSITKRTINWEDRDLLKMAGQQAASHLAQHQTDQALSQAKQFEAFNRLSAYVVHDLKNILAQQSLIVSNAEKHKHNPLFVDDVIRTVDNSVGRMTKLMEQMKSGMRGSDYMQEINLNLLVEKVVATRACQKPAPELDNFTSPILIQTNKDELATVLGHIIQNAQDATGKEGKVIIRLNRIEENAVVEVEDTGTGMDADFVKNRLFRPFDSTKGLTGMGIGAFESREFVRSQGGDIQVSSTPGKGSLFKISLPCLSDKDNHNIT